MKIPQPTSNRFFGLAAVSIILFYVSLHPLSDFVGGIAFLMLGWALPTVIVVSLASALAWVLPVTPSVRILIAVVLTIPIGLNTKLPELISSVGYRADVSSDIRGRVVWPDPDRLSSADIKFSNWGAFFVYPASSRVELAGDEGCGCFYFLDTKKALYSNLVAENLFDAVKRRGSVLKYETLKDPSREMKDVHLVLTFWQESASYRSLVEVYASGEKIAAFAHKNIPRRAYAEPSGVGRGDIDKNFWPNATDLLMHSNLWSTIADRVAPNYFPDAEFRRFVADVVPTFKNRFGTP